jgi:hypothetical protein
MTYNFDPDRWYENQRLLLERRRAQEELDAGQFAQEMERLDERYDEMLRRLDSAFELPHSHRTENGS